MGRILITTVVPCYNEELYVEECIESLVRQTIGIENMQIILVNDASTDSSLEYMQRYQRKYPENIQVIDLEQNQGQGHARNVGIAQAKGEYLAFLDADDWIEPETYEKMVGIAMREDCDIVQCSTVWEDKYGEQRVDRVEIPQKKYIFSDVESRRCFLDKCSFSNLSGASVFKLEWILKEKILFPNFRKYEDNYVGGIMLYAMRSYYTVYDVYYHYRILDQSNSHSRNDLGHFARLNVELELIKYYRDHGIFQTYYKNVRDRFINMFYENTLHIMFTQFDYIPMDVIQIMQSTVKELFPDWLDYYKEIRERNKCSLLLTEAFDFPESVWQELKQVYCKSLVGDSSEYSCFFLKMEASLNICKSCR